MFSTSAKQLGIAAIVVAVAVALACILIFMAEAQEPPPLEKSEHDDLLNHLDRQAIESAYVKQVEKLFAVWMVDYSTKGQPNAALRGHRNARKGFIEAINAIEQRK